MPRNPVQFAVVREDARTDLAVLARTRARRALLVASGGCTAFELLARHPALEVTLVDPNPAQIDLVRRKLDALARPHDARRAALFNVGDADPAGLCACGNFEALFRQLRGFLCEFVAPAASWRAFFEPHAARADLLRRWFADPWWPVAFDLFLGDALLEAMFTRAALQHARPGSYARYFQALFERGLQRDDAESNPFLHHVLLGAYLDRAGARPAYLDADLRDAGARVHFVAARVEDVTDFAPYDFVGLSNVMDWMDEAAIAALARRVGATLAPGAALVFRQLNNDARHDARFGPRVRFDGPWSARLLQADRSLFYNQLHVGFGLQPDAGQEVQRDG